VTLLDRRNFHLFQPLLYQVATGGLSPANIASPLREVLKHQQNVRVLLATVDGIDVVAHRVKLRDGELDYDTLIVATGAEPNYFGNTHWEMLVPGLKTIEDATEIRHRILLAFESAERTSDAQQIAAWLTFVVIGGGPTGVELAGAIAELARDTLRHNFRTINPARTRILLLEGTDRILPTYHPTLSRKAAASLQRLGVEVRTQAMVTDIQSTGVTFRVGSQDEEFPSRTVLWAAGVKPSRLGGILASETGASLDRSGRVVVEPNLSVPDHPEIFVIGDLAHFDHQTGTPLPGLAPVAIQQGRYVARVVQRRLRGEQSPAFHYRDGGCMATIGRAAAVAEVGRLRFSGYPAWLAWLFVHLMGLVTFQNRLLVFLQWAWSYFTYNRAARLITGENPLPVRRGQAGEQLGAKP
jgi:NADH dehydrogenase